MANERLRRAIIDADLTVAQLAAHVGVDPKTVERWITKDRIPHPRHRVRSSRRLSVDEAELWPLAADDGHARAASEAELIRLYPHRGVVPKDLWYELLDSAKQAVDMLVYAGLFLPDGHADLATLVADKARQGTRMRLMFGDPESPALQQRGVEEGIGEGLSARAKLSLAYLEDAFGVPGLEVRLHTTTLYNSIFRYDDDMLVNMHTFGAPAAQSPVLHLRRIPGGRLFDHYLKSLERVWERARPVTGPERSGQAT